MSSKLARRLLVLLVAAGALPACGNINDGHPPVPFTVRASVSTTGVQPNARCEEAAVSGDGRFVVFTTVATNLGTAVSPDFTQVYRRDLATGVTEMVSVDPALAPGDDSSSRPAISFDGRFVAFQSYATNLLGGAEPVPHVYIRDMNAPAATATSIVSQDAAGNPGDDYSAGPSISADGRYVAFESLATNFGDTHGSGVLKIYRKDRTTGEVIPISVTSTGDDPTVDAVDGSVTPSISADGSVVAYASDCSDIVAGDTNTFIDIFVATVGGGGTVTTVIASPNTTGGVADESSFNPSLSGDGLFVAFHSKATNLIPLDTNDVILDVFVYSVTLNTVTLVSKNSQGIQAETPADSQHASISSNGRLIAFQSVASNLVPGDTNLSSDIFVHDTWTGVTERVSVDTSNIQAGVSQNSFAPSISADGKAVAFTSKAAFVKDDTNGLDDVYARLPLR
jgi:Tol biopolymer transport system component